MRPQFAASNIPAGRRHLLQVVRAFVQLRQMLASNVELWIKQLAIRLGCKSPQSSRWLSRKLAALEKNYDIKFKAVFEAIHEQMTPLQPKKKHPIGFAPCEKIMLIRLAGF